MFLIYLNFKDIYVSCFREANILVIKQFNKRANKDVEKKNGECQ